jgi:PST family polysaccharide transporter
MGAEGLGARAVRGGAVVFGAMILQKLIALGLMAILARLLAPADYGLYGMVFALEAFLLVFADLGLSMATVQKAELTGPQVSTLFWVNLAFSGLLSLVTASAAPAVAWFYREPRLVGVTLWLAPGFLMAGLGTQHAALMQRRMRFGRLAACDAAALVAGGAAGVWMALKGLGVYAIVGQTLSQTAARSALAWALSGWLPGLPVRGSGVRGMLRFGGYLAGFNIVNYFARNLDKVLLGRFWGAAPLGLYTRAYALMTYPISLVSQPMGQVMIPALSRLQKDTERLRDAYRRSLFVIALL